MTTASTTGDVLIRKGKNMKSRKGRTSGLAHTPLYLLVCAVLGAGVAGPARADTITTTMTYDAGDHVTSVTDPRRLVTTYAYDGLGQLWQQVSPDTGTTNYSYDAAGRRASMTRADGTVTTYGYDSLDRVVSLSAGGQTQSFAYDNCTNGLGRLCSASDSTGATSYTYTPEGWLAGRGLSIDGTTYALGYGYDAMGRLAAVNYPDGHQAVYSYTDGVVTDVTLNLGGTSVTGASNITYRPGNLAMASWQSSNGLTNTLTYDTDGRLTGISVPNVQSLAFSYDTADRIASLTNGVDPSQSESYDYDDQSRLTGAYGVANTESYAYDADGNRIWQTVNGSVANFGISATSNQLMSIRGAATQSYGYDPQGNTTTVNGVATYQYNPFNRLASTSGASDYVNPEGQRLRKISGGGTTYFAPEGGALIAEYTDGAWDDYLWLNGHLVGRIRGSAVIAIHDDQTGRPQAATDANGTVAWKAYNRPFGRTVTQDGIGGLNIGFPGQYYDIERGTWKNGYRDYDENLGRYVESDPIGLTAGPNTYIYVGDEPLDAIDPLGLRGLTHGEISMLTPIFNNTVDLSKIDIESGAGMDPRAWGPIATGNAVTLENTIRFPSSGYQSDFSKADLSSQAWLVHEMTHAYQFQNEAGYSWLKAAKEGTRNDTYKYGLNDHPCFFDYRYEQQAAIVADYYSALRLGSSSVGSYEALLNPVGLGINH